MTTPTPSVGRIVLIGVNPDLNNGADVAPAIITRVWNDRCVNVRVLVDGNSAPLWQASVYLLADRAEFDEHTAQPSYKAFWPPRI